MGHLPLWQSRKTNVVASFYGRWESRTTNRIPVGVPGGIARWTLDFHILPLRDKGALEAGNNSVQRRSARQKLRSSRWCAFPIPCAVDPRRICARLHKESRWRLKYLDSAIRRRPRKAVNRLQIRSDL